MVGHICVEREQYVHFADSLPLGTQIFGPTRPGSRARTMSFFEQWEALLTQDDICLRTGVAVVILTLRDISDRLATVADLSAILRLRCIESFLHGRS